ncbi:hypothetical protein H920_08888 [Fukomys damarensis]|uniref:Uncharacterized protein n=1 Tax=Fukomys damarensis TaxID=885580 RepID=A0A091DH01_FUKDA|nr:hypothetical protein H920_08888 [Fukomys damarensis]
MATTTNSALPLTGDFYKLPPRLESFMLWKLVPGLLPPPEVAQRWRRTTGCRLAREKMKASKITVRTPVTRVRLDCHGSWQQIPGRRDTNSTAVFVHCSVFVQLVNMYTPIAAGAHSCSCDCHMGTCSRTSLRGTEREALQEVSGGRSSGHQTGPGLLVSLNLQTCSSGAALLRQERIVAASLHVLSLCAARTEEINLTHGHSAASPALLSKAKVATSFLWGLRAGALAPGMSVLERAELFKAKATGLAVAEKPLAPLKTVCSQYESRGCFSPFLK